MRKLIVIMVAIAVVLTACGTAKSGADNPKEATEEFYLNVKSGEYTKAQSYMSKEALEMYSDSVLNDLKELYNEKDRITSPDEKTVSITGNTAKQEITSTTLNSPITTTKQKVSLAKIDGKWFITSIEY